MSELVYVAMDRAGDIVGVESSADTALYDLRKTESRIIVETIPDDHELELNPATGKSMPQRALEQCGIPPITLDEVMSYSLEDAHHES